MMPMTYTPYVRYSRGLWCILCVFAVCNVAVYNVAVYNVALGQTAPTSPEALGYLDPSLQGSFEPAGDIYSISADGRYILSSSLWAELTLWDTESGQVVGLYDGHSSSDFGPSYAGPPVAMGIGAGNAAIVADGLIVSQASSQGFYYDYSLQLYNPATQETQREHPQSDCFDMLALQERLVVACNGQLELWTVDDQQLVQQDTQPRPNPERFELYLVADPSSSGFVLIEPPSPQLPDDPVVVSFWTFEPLQMQQRVEGNAAHLGGGVHISSDGTILSLALNYDQDRLELLRTPRDLSAPERIPLAVAASDYYSRALPAISPDGACVVAPFAAEQANLFEVATGRYFVSSMEPPFSETYSWLWPTQDRVLWSGFTSTFPHPRMLVWRLGEAEDFGDETLSNDADYPLMASGMSDWENLLRRSDLDNIGEVFGVSQPETVRLYDQDAEQLITRLLQPFTEEARLEFGRDDFLSIGLFPSEDGVMRAEAEFPVLDDSVVAVRYAFSLRSLPLRSGAVWAVQEAYRQQQCGRGDLANQWVDGVDTLCL